MSDERREIYEITRQLRRWLEWQGADDAMGVIPASEQKREELRELYRRRRKARMERIQSSFRSEAGDEAEEAPEEEPSGTESTEADSSGVWHELGERRHGSASAESSESSEGTDEQAGDEVPQTNAEKLAWLRDYMGDCRRCPLWEERTNLVFGEGNPEARLLFAGEAPGYNEDRTGRPFVGRAGKLLDKMIEAMGLERGDVYICNVLKSRPPNNRDPQPEEIAECIPFLHKQIAIIEPEVIVTLGRPAMQNLLDTDRPLGAVRGRWQTYRDIDVMPTYHPAYILHSEGQKKQKARRKTWNDLQQVMEKLGLKGD